MPKVFSLQKRLLIRTFGAVMVIWFCTAVFVWFQAEHETDELLDAHLAQSAALLVVQQNVTPAYDELKIEEPPTLHKYAHRVAYQVFDGKRLLIHSPNVGHLPIAHHTEGFETLTLADGNVWRIFATQSVHRGTQIYVAERVDTRHEILRAMLLGFFPPLVIGLPLLLIGLWWTVHLGLLPLQNLRQAILKRDTKALEMIRIPDTPQEVQPMIDALNDLLLRLTQRIQNERRFIADAAHELRTPIAGIRAQAQVALSSVTDDKVRQQALQDTLIGCDRASRLVEQLLTLARVEGPQDLPSETFRLDLLAQQTIADLTPAALRRGQTIELLVSDTLQVNGQSTLWHILLRNLIDNALRYSPPGARVRIQAQRIHGDQVQMTIEDNGAGLSPAQMEHLGERFFRVLGTNTTGSGLGWSIVRHIASLQQIGVKLGKSQLGGLLVTLLYPSA